ncbi:hypothetical protein HD554DRAFT_1193044 [Boletus coccyginus]|nr:hypothetical protein HD554DRAFT_1193044 [Boletus coccyginus]
MTVCRWHWFRPRRIIPGQRIHFSVWCGDAYRPHATLGNGIKIPTMLEHSSERTIRNHPLDTKLSHGTMPTGRITVLAWIQRYAAHELGILVKCRLENPNISDRAKWVDHIEDRSDFEKFIAIIAYIFAFNLTIKDGTEVVRLIDAAKQCLRPILSASGHPDLARALSLLPHLTTDQTLRQEIIASSGVTSALIRILEWSIKNQSDNTLLVVDSICHFLQTNEAELQDAMVTQLTAKPVSNGTSGLIILSRLLGTNGNSCVVCHRLH